MKTRAGSLFLLLGALCLGQQPTLTTDETQLGPQGGIVKVVATVTFESVPGALGWSVSLPPGWTLKGTAGLSVPDISPPSGSSGKLDWAFVTVPASPVQFEILLQYPPGAQRRHVIRGELVSFREGKLDSVAAAPVIFQRVPTRAAVSER